MNQPAVGRGLVALLLGGLFASACISIGNAQILRVIQPTSAEYEVYDFVLELFNSASPIDTLVVADSTFSPPGAARVLSSDANVSASIRLAYDSVNSGSYPLVDSLFTLTTPVRVISRPYLDTLEYVALSRVAFSSDSTEAIVGLTYFCGYRCSTGGIAHLERINGDWTSDSWQTTFRGQ